MDRAELLDKIRRIDENAFFSGTVEQGVRAKMVIIGASALLLCELSQKGVTKDVDVLEAEQVIKRFISEDRDFNSYCSAYAQCLPYNFEDRLVKIEMRHM